MEERIRRERPETDLIAQFCQIMQLPQVDADQYASLTLAYIGDSVFDLLVKTYFVSKGDKTVQAYHQLTSGIVRAHTQAEMAEQIFDALDAKEQAVYKRGRNAKSYTKAKNATTIDYRKATGFEALLGYLYLEGAYARLVQLLQLGFARIGLEEQERVCSTKNIQ